ncbi:MAG: GxxExxY protein [Candidatus Cloacimonetes bacterium]|nr:GxxExxY protein [Candidatus Cloacimonadota bacterium]
MLENEELTYRIIGACFKVHQELGPVHKELVYQRALSLELKEQKLAFDKEVKIPIQYRKKTVGCYQPDFVIENTVVLEIKAIPILAKNAEDQIYFYLKGSKYKIGLLINFGSRKLDIRRRIY